MLAEIGRHKNFSQIWRQIRARRPMHVLIVDDDVDAALFVASIFRQFDCGTTFALNVEDAKRRIVAGKADVIILDWQLSEKICADEVLTQSIRVIEKFSVLRNQLRRSKPKIISYSSSDEVDIHLPNSQYFEHLDHWKKPMNHRDLIQRSLKLLEGLKF